MSLLPDPRGLAQRLKNLERLVRDIERAPIPEFFEEEVPQPVYEYLAYVADWTEGSTLGAVLLFRNSKWIKMSDTSFQNAIHNEAVKSVELFGKYGFIADADNTLYRSTDKGKTWAENHVGLDTTDDAIYEARDAAGRFWRINQDTTNGDLLEVYRSSDKGVTWSLIWTSSNQYDRQPANWWPCHAVACHPRNPNVIAISVRGAVSQLPLYLLSTDGETFSEVALPGTDMQFGGEGDIAFTPKGSLLMAYDYYDSADQPVRSVSVARATSPYTSPAEVELLSGDDTNDFTYGVRMLVNLRGHVYVAYGRDSGEGPDGGEAEQVFWRALKSTSDGASFTMISESSGTPFFAQPPLPYEDQIPGQISGLNFDELNGDFWVLFHPISNRTDYATVTDPIGLAWKYHGSWSDQWQKIKNVSGLPLPAFSFQSVSRLG